MNTSIFSLFFHAGIVVQLVMLLLLLASIFSWTLIFKYAQLLRQCQREQANFEYNFQSGIDLGALYSRLSVYNTNELSALENIFVVGFREFANLSERFGNLPTEIVKGVERAIRVSLSKELDKLERNLSFLATIQSMSPFIGLFGTVWGIMHAFKDLAGVQQASMSMVAPGISEALVATAMGLVAAIPAGIAYNRYVHKIDFLANSYQNFIDEFLNIVSQQALLTAGKTRVKVGT